MRKRLLNQRTTKRMILLVFSFMLLLPNTAWGQTITVAGYTPDANGDITGEKITGTVSFSSSNDTYTLTLDNATIEGGIEWTGNSGKTLTIKIKGVSSVIGNNTTPAFKVEYNCSLKVERLNNTDAATLKYVGNLDNCGLEPTQANTFHNFSNTYNDVTYNYYTTEDVYGLTVAGNTVHNISGEPGYKDDIMKDGTSTPTVTYNSSSNTLTLDNARVNGTVSTSLTELNVHLKGHSVFNVETNSTSKTYLFNFNGSSQYLTLNYSAESFGDVLEGKGTYKGKLLEVADNSITELYDGKSLAESKVWRGDYGTENEYVYCKLSKPYLYVGGTVVDKSNYNSFEDYFSFNAGNSSLTLFKAPNDYTDNDFLVKSNLANLTVNINISDNILGYGLKNVTGRVFVYTGNDANSTLTLNIAEGKALKAIWTTGINETGSTNWINEGFAKTNFYTNLSNMESSGIYAEASQVSGDYSVLFSNVELYPLSVAGIRVTSLNSANILNDPLANITVSFTPAEGTTPATLTLDGATLSNNNIVSGLENLTIHLKGENYIKGNSETDPLSTAISSTVSTATLTFTSDVENNAPVGKLMFQYVTKPIDGFSGETVYNNGLDLGTIYNNISESYTGVGEVQYGLSIGDTQVTSANYSDIKIGNVSIGASYNKTTKTLTLENATIEGSSIVWEVDDDLTVEIKGNNSITSSATIFVAMKYNHELSFTRGDATNDCKLELNSDGNPVILGFSNYDAPTVTDMFWVPTKDLYGKIISATITTSLLGGGAGTESDPLVISTFDDLKNFSKYVNCGALTTQYVKLADNLENNTLDCSGGTGFEPIGPTYTIPFIGTFDGNNKTISGLTYNASGSGYDNYSALFGFIGDDANHQGTVKNLTLKNCSFTGAENIGGIVAMLKNGTIENCTVDNCILTSGNQQTVYVGGIVSDMSKGAISGCKINGGTITGLSTYNTGGGYTYVGGIAGYANTSETISISSCEVKDVTINSTHAYTYGYHLGGIIGYCYSAGTITISNNTVKGATNLNCVDNDIDNSHYMYVGAVVGDKGSATYNGNTYESTVKTSKKLGTNDAIVLSGQEERGIGYYYDGTYMKSDFDIIDQVMLAGTKKVTITMPANSGSYEMTSGYLISDDGKDLYVLPDSVVSVKLYCPFDGKKPRLTLNDENIEVTATEKFEDNGDYDCTEFSWTMPNADKTATVTYPIDLAAISDDIFSIDDANYTGSAIEPTTVKVSGVPGATGVTELTKDTHFTIKSYKLNDSSVNSPVDAGIYTVTIEGIGDYIGTKEVSYRILMAYDLWINDTQITELNANDFYGDGTVIFTPATDTKPTNTLTLNRATINGAIKSGLDNLTIYLIAGNTIKGSGSSLITSSNGGTLTFDSDVETVSHLVFKDNSGNAFPNDPISGFSEIKYGTMLEYDESSKEVHWWDIEIGQGDGAKRIYSKNKNDILEDGGSVTYSYDATNGHVITLNNAEISYIWTDIHADITIALNGTNKAINTVSTYAIYSNNGDIKFIKAEGATSAELEAQAGSNIAISSFTVGSGLYEKPISEIHTIITDDPEFIIINGTVITDDTPIGTAESGITYNSTDKVLTFKNYAGELTSPIITGVTGLTVKLEGTSSVDASTLDYPFKAMTNTATIVFDGSDGGELDIKTNQTDGLFVGFADGAITYDQAVYWYDSSESNQIHRIQPAEALDGYFSGSNEYGTYYNDGADTYAVPLGMKAYVVTGVSGSKVITEETTVLPPYTVVLLEKGTATCFAKIPASGAAPAGNLLTRATSDVAVTSTSLLYVLFNDTFVKATAGSPIPSGKNYLDLSSNQVAVNGANARGFYNIGDGDTTGIQSMDNGQWIMDNASDEWFDIQGRRIQKPTKPGLYIVNGKKVVVYNK